MYNIKFSVIIPVYNAEKTIRHCLKSILDQTYSNFEVIIINDGSTDGTLKSIKIFEKLDPRVKIFSFENAGVSKARQRGVINSSGQYLIFVDSDDEITPRLLENLYETVVLQGYPDIIRYQCKLVNDNPLKNPERYNYHESSMEVITGIEALKKWALSDKKFAVYWLYAFKKDVFANITFPTLNCYEDVAVIPILVANAKSVVTIDFVGYKYTYDNLLSITNKKGIDYEEKRALDFVKACAYALTELRKNVNLSDKDFAFLVEDYTRRLDDKYRSLPRSLQIKLKKNFLFVI